MPNVIIIKPINTLEEEKNALRNIANIMEKIIQTEFGAKVEIELVHKNLPITKEV